MGESKQGLGASAKADQALAVPVEPASGLVPTGFGPSREDLKQLTKPQKRVLLETAAASPSAKRGHRVTGAQWPPVLKLRHLRLLYVDDHSGHFGRDTMWLRPTEKGRAWARAITDISGQAEKVENQPLAEFADTESASGMEARQAQSAAARRQRRDSPMPSKQQIEAIEPCPFCGSQAELMEGHRNHWRVECPKCGVRRAQFANGGVEEDKARAVRCWNRRVPQAAFAVMSEEMRDEMVRAYVTGATDVHIYWRAGGSDTEPDFTEAAHEYAADRAALSPRNADTRSEA